MTPFGLLIDPSLDPCQTNSREYQRQTIDSEIKLLEDSIRALKHRRNSLAPISSLPPEVITAIFSLLPRHITESTSTPDEEPDPLEWLRVSHVCHQWRDIVLNQPLFWSRVDFTNIRLAGAAEILSRAKTVPLYLEARSLEGHWDNATFSAFREELQVHVSHICHLLISTNPLPLEEILEGLVSPAPALESLSLLNEEKWCRAAIPETLFGGTTPRLSRLELGNCVISWKSSLLKGLRSLEIRSPSVNARPGLSVWLSALEEMRQLESLILYSASPIAPPIPFDVERTVALPSLTYLDISSSAKNCALALAHLDLPALNCLYVEATIGFSHGDGVQRLLPYVVQHAHGPQDTQPLQSALILDAGKYLGVFMWTVPDVDAEKHDPPTLLTVLPPTRVGLSFKFANKDEYTSNNSCIEIIGDAMAALPLDGLVTLIPLVTQYRSAWWPGDFWLRNLPKWPLLRRVRLKAHVFDQFVDCLLADKGGFENPLLPSLKSLSWSAPLYPSAVHFAYATH